MATSWRVAGAVGVMFFNMCGGNSDADPSATGGVANALGGGGSAGDGRGGSFSRGGTPSAGASTSEGGAEPTAGAPGGAAGASGGAAGAPGGAAGAPGGAAGSGEPTLLCGSATLAGDIYCSAEAACQALECGKPWSNYDANGCRRTQCQTATDCPEGSRCVPSAITGNFDAGCFADYDSCDDSSGACSCVRYECYRQALCVSERELPVGAECPIADLDCEALARADAGLRAYEQNLEVDRDTPTEADVVACQAKIAAALETCSK
jgi:hypothetical protein